MITTMEDLAATEVGTKVDVYANGAWQEWDRVEGGLRLDGLTVGLDRFEGSARNSWVRRSEDRPYGEGEYLRNRSYDDHYHALWVVGPIDDDRILALVLRNGEVTGSGPAMTSSLRNYERFTSIPDDLPHQIDWQQAVLYLGVSCRAVVDVERQRFDNAKMWLHRWATETHPAPPPSFDRTLSRIGMDREREHTVSVTIAGTRQLRVQLTADEDPDLEVGQVWVPWTKRATITKTASGHQADDVSREEVAELVPAELRGDSWEFSARCCAG